MPSIACPEVFLEAGPWKGTGPAWPRFPVKSSIFFVKLFLCNVDRVTSQKLNTLFITARQRKLLGFFFGLTIYACNIPKPMYKKVTVFSMDICDSC